MIVDTKHRDEEILDAKRNDKQTMHTLEGLVQAMNSNPK
jgi:hypothetical protein